MESDLLLKQLEEKFIELHKPQLKSSGVPEIFWPSLFKKLRDEIFDAGDYFQICLRVDEDDKPIGYKAICSTQDGLKKTNPNAIFLIDHAWTYRVNEARKNLLDHENLLNRMCILMNIETSNDLSQNLDDLSLKEKKINAVIENMWKFNQTYKISTEKLTDEEREPIWYIMDEFGSSLRHSVNATVECAPFYYVPTKSMFSIMWIVEDIDYGDELTRDYAYNIKDEALRKAKLVPWNDNSDDDYDFCDDEQEATSQPEPDTSYFKSGRQDETLPVIADLSCYVNDLNSNRSKKATFNVFTDLESVRENLNDSKYQIVEQIENADIIFIRKHFKDYKNLYEKSPNCLVNQFPFENVITVKDLLAIVCRRIEDSSSWLPITYNLSYELPKFITYFKLREKNGLDNHWILKPWNLARSIDTTVTKNLNQIIRSQETGPKIACKYITDPVLYYREELGGSVKFDIRYIVLLKSIEPLSIYTYNVFWLRFANKTYSLENLEDYEKHFTVMNYRPVNLKQINFDEFIPEFETQNPRFKWTEIQNKIFKMIRKVFEGASKENPPKGIANNPQSRAMYAVDLMLDWREGENKTSKSIEPMICEVNFMPDCTRACKFHPHFFNDVFNTLFTDSSECKNFIQI